MKKIFLVLLFLLLIFVDAFSYAHAIQTDISNNVVRLHVIANSDNAKDQELKLKVRDSILEFMMQSNYSDYTSAYNFINNSTSDIQKIAEDTLLRNGSFETVQVEFGEFYFPKKDYDSLSFPKGIYTGLKVTIGHGKGQNWWCMMYPTLCFSKPNTCNNEALKELENSLNKDSFSIVSKPYEFRFKIVDWFNSF